jgi:hypothetical protein
MKKILISFIIASASLTATAQNRHYGYWHHQGGPSPWIWVAPTIIGGVIGYEVARNQSPIIVQQPAPVIIQPPYLNQTTVCTSWNEIQTADGKIYRERTCTQ